MSDSAALRLDPLVARVQGHVRRLERECPRALAAAARWHAIGGRQKLWPPWCYLPLGAAYGLLQRGRAHHAFLSILVPQLVTLAAWKATQGIYVFDDRLFRALARAEIRGALPHAESLRLPEWTVYVPIADGWLPDLRGQAVHGVFASLQRLGPGSDAEALLLMFDIATRKKPDLAPLLVRLGRPLRDSLRETTNAVRSCNRGDPLSIATKRAAGLGEMTAALESVAPAVLSAVFYLASRRPDIEPGIDPMCRPTAPSPTPAPPAPRAWHVGYKLGPALVPGRACSAGAEDPQGTNARQTRTRATPADAYVCPAHWQRYWYGRRRTPEARYREWVCKLPYAANVRPDRPLVPTIRPVPAPEPSALNVAGTRRERSVGREDDPSPS